MKIRGKIVDLLLLAGGRQRITIETTDDFRSEYDRLREKEIGAEIKEYRKPRSLDANAYFHVIVNKIAAVQGTSDEEVKKLLVVRYGTVERDEDGNVIAAMLPMSADIDRLYPYTRCYKTVEMDGRTYNCYLFYKQTRYMDSAEMSHLIDGAVHEARELGIDTDPPDVIARYKEEWRP